MNYSLTKEQSIDYLKDLWNEVYNEDSDGYNYAIALDMAIEALLADRPQGEWVSNHDSSWNCSECGLRVFIYAKGNYCPNCGARMKGGDSK